MFYIKNKVAGGLKDVGKQVMIAGGTIAAAGMAIVGPLVAAVEHFISFGSELEDMSARTGVAVGSLAELKFAAEQTGATLEDVETAIKHQQKEGLGSNFDAVAEQIAAVEDPMFRVQLAMDAWGKAGTKLLPMINNLKALRQEARDLGLVPTAEQVAMADALGDAWDKVKSILGAAVFNIGAALAPMLLPALETVKEIAVSIGKWVKQNKELFQTLALIGGALIVVGTTIFGIGTTIAIIGTVITALLSPVSLIVAGIVAITIALVASVTAWLRFTESGKAAAESVKTALTTIIPVLNTIFRLLVGGHWREAGMLMGKQIGLGLAISLDSIKDMFPKFLADVLLPGNYKKAIKFLQESIVKDLIRAERMFIVDAKAAGGPEELPLRRSQTAATTHEALALTFGQPARTANGIALDTLSELKQLRQHSIKAHQEQLREMAKRGELTFGK